MPNLSILTKAAELSEFNPAAAKLLMDLANSETGLDIQKALDNYDEAVKV